MKNKVNIDQFFKGKFSTLGKPDASQDWMAMEKMLNKKAKKAIFFRWGLSILLLLFVATGTWFWMDYSNLKPLVVSKKQTNTATIKQQNSIPLLMNPIPNSNKVESNSTLNSITPSIKFSKRQRSENTDKNVKYSPTQKNEERTITNSTEAETDFIRERWLIWNLATTKQLVLFENKIELLSPQIIEKMFLPYSKWQFGVAPFVGLNIYQRKKPTSQIIASETPLNNFNFGLTTFAKYGNWNIRLGVSSLNLSEKTNYKQTEYSYTYDTSFVLIKRNFETTTNGKTTALVKEIINTTTDSTEVVNCPDCLAKFQYVQVPLSAQYTFGKKRLMCFVEGGVSLSFLRKTSGLYSVSGITNKEGYMDYQIGELSKSHASKTLWSTHARLGLKYRLNTKTSVFGSYGASYFQQSMLSSYKQKAQLQQIQFGMEFGF